MVLANCAAARYLGAHRQPLLYRVHAAPDQESLEALVSQAYALGYELKARPPEAVFAECQRHLAEREDPVLQMLMLRSLSQAMYQPDNIGHFGLAESDYTHFTSPIRRYPDLWVHRLIIATLSGQTLQREGISGAALTELEKRADKASWHMNDRMKCLYMLSHVGSTFDGEVVSVHPFGCFIRLISGIEVMVHVSSLREYYVYDAGMGALRSQDGEHVLHIGQALTVEIESIDLMQARIQARN